MGRLFQPFLQLLALALNQTLLQQIQYLKSENAILRARLPRRIVVKPRERQILLRYGKPVGAAIKDLISIVSPRTFARWLQQEQSESASNGRSMSKPGRKRTDDEIRQLIVRLAEENEWGYSRILGELRKLGIRKVSRTTVLNILREHGLDAGPRRGPGSWHNFLKRHFATLWACDFFSVQTWTIQGVVEIYVLFFLHVQTRRVFISGMTAHPNGDWMAQQARNLALHLDATGLKATHLIRDRDAKFTEQFEAILKGEGIKVVKSARRAPNMNAFAERFVLTIRNECLNRFIFIGERHLRYVIKQYEIHYAEQRPHQGIGNRLLDSTAPKEEALPFHLEHVVCEERLGGLLKHYRLAA